MKFSSLMLGKRAEHPISFRVIGGDGEPVECKCLVRPLDGHEETTAIEFANAYAEKRGAKGELQKSPLWELGYMVKVIHLGCLDPDSSEKARERFFATEDEVLGLPREAIAFIHELHQNWQDRCSPMQRRMPASEMLEKAREIVESDDEGPYLRLAPGLRWIFTRFLACTLLMSQEGSSSPSLPSANGGEDSSANPPNESEPTKSEAEPPLQG